MSEPAPLPRLGEVFFDVRGNSRSMRLSWYADTGVAVFSIWQAGMCTGTFRLPMADLSRMIAILQRGPSPQGRGRAPVNADRPGEDRGSDSDWYYGPGGEEPARSGPAGTQGGYGAERTTEYGRSARASEHGRGERGPAEYDAGGYGPAGRGGGSVHYDADLDMAGHGSAGGHGPADYGSSDRDGDTRYYGGGYGSAGQPSGDDYQGQGYQQDYGRDELGPDGGYQRGYEQPGYGSAGYGSAPTDYGTDEYPGYPEQRRAGSDRRHAEPDGSGYRDDDRFAGPYAADGGQTYANESPASPTGYPGDIGDDYPADRRPVSRSERYLEPSAAEDAYSYGADYRYR